MYKFILVLLTAFIVGGCASANTKGSDTEKNYNTKVVNKAEGTLIMFTYMPVDAKTNMKTDQSPNNNPKFEGKADASLAGSSGQAAIAKEGARQVVEGIFDLVGKIQDPVKIDKEITELKNDEKEVTKPVIHTEEFTSDGEIKITSTRIRWKPISEGDKKLVVLTPSSFGINPGIQLLGVNERGRFVGGTNPDRGGPRATYRFSKPGSKYPDNLKVKIKNKIYVVPSPGKNYNK